MGRQAGSGNRSSIGRAASSHPSSELQILGSCLCTAHSFLPFRRLPLISLCSLGDQPCPVGRYPICPDARTPGCPDPESPGRRDRDRSQSPLEEKQKQKPKEGKLEPECLGSSRSAATWEALRRSVSKCISEACSETYDLQVNSCKVRNTEPGT